MIGCDMLEECSVETADTRPSPVNGDAPCTFTYKKDLKKKKIIR